MTTEIEINHELDKWFRTLNVSIDIKDSTKPKTINNLDDFIRFIQKEVEFWGQYSNRHQYAREIFQYFNSISSTINQALTFGDSNLNQAQNTLKNAINLVKSEDWRAVYSISPLAKRIAIDLKNNPKFTAPFFDYIRNGNSNINGQSLEYWTGLYDLINHIYGENNSGKSVEAEKLALTDLRDTYLSEQHRLSSIHDDVEEQRRTEIANYIAKLEEWSNQTKERIEHFVIEKDNGFQSLFQKNNDELNDLKTRYEQTISLKAPAEYWKSLSKRYFIFACLWTGIMLILSLGFVLYLDSALNSLPNWVGNQTHDSAAIIRNVKGTIVFALIISTIAYVIRLFVKLALSDFHLSRDAKERWTLTIVYLALLDEKGVNVEDRGVVLQAIFSRADTGLLKGDSSPTMPVPGFDILSQVNKAASNAK